MKKILLLALMGIIYSCGDNPSYGSDIKGYLRCPIGCEGTRVTLEDSNGEVTHVDVHEDSQFTIYRTLNPDEKYQLRLYNPYWGSEVKIIPIGGIEKEINLDTIILRHLTFSN